MVGGFSPGIQGVSFKRDLNISFYYKDAKNILYVIIILQNITLSKRNVSFFEVFKIIEVFFLL